MELNRRQILKILMIIALSILFFTALQNLGEIFSALQSFLSLISPFVVGLCIAFIVNIPMRFFESKLLKGGAKGRAGRFIQKLSRPISLILSILVISVILTVLFLLIIPELRRTVIIIAENLPAQIDAFWLNLSAWIQTLGIDQLKLNWMDLNINWSSLGQELVKYFTQGGSAVISVTSSVIKNTVNVFLGLVFAVYVLLAKNQLYEQIRKLAYAFLPEKMANSLFEKTLMSSRIFSNFVIGQCTEAVILGILCYVGMLIFSFPYALMIACLVAVTALIPVFGAFIGTAVGMLLILFHDPVQSLWFLLFMIVLQQLEGNLIYPRVVGTSVGLPGIWVLVAVTVGGSLFGAIGMLISVPLCALLYCLLRDAVNKLLKRKKIHPSLYTHQGF